MKKRVFLFFFVGIICSAYSQKDMPLVFSNKAEKVLFHNMSEGFYLIKTDEIKTFCAVTETSLINRYGENFYIIRFFGDSKIASLDNTHIYEIENDWKLSQSLLHIQNSGLLPKSKIVVSVHTINAAIFKENWSKKSPESSILAVHKNDFLVEMPAMHLEKMLDDIHTTHISLYTKPKVESPNIDSDLGANGINRVHRLYPDLNGEGLVASVKEFFFDISDIDFRGRYVLTGLEAEELDPHASLIGTAIGGGKNSSERSRGVADAVQLTSSSFLNIFPDEEQIFLANDISVQNHSYGTSIESEYGNEAAAYDEIANVLPQLVHVFSSGNSGSVTSTEGIYSGIPNFANQTGNFKGAKNIITVGSIDRQGRIDPRSSRGPAYDGRVKPELVSYAPGGTSDAAALVSGVAILLQQAYKNTHNGALPSSSLIKSILIAGTDDIGPAGIDFQSGYGNLNAEQSVAVTMQGQFFEDTVIQDASMSVDIVVPQNTQILKIALNWNDLPANPGDERALVNDLDMLVTDNASNTWLPWVLNTAPDVAALTQPASRGEDHLNNVEFITIDDPVPGNYTIRVRGTEITGAQQSFSVAYDFVTDNDFEWIFPTASDAVVVEDILTSIRWRSTLPTEEGVIEINKNEEGWELLTENVDLNNGFFEFLMGENMGGTAQLRMTVAGERYLSEVFSFSEEIVPRILFNCEEEVLFGWNSVPNATSYNLRFLDDLYMEVAQTVTDTTALIIKNDFSETIFSIEPVFNDIAGVRGRALDYQLQEVSCYYINFTADLIDQGIVNTSLSLSTSINVEEVFFEKVFEGEITSLGSFSPPFNDELVLNLDDENLFSGRNRYRAIIVLTNGDSIVTDEVDVFVPDKNTLILFPNPISQGANLNIVSEGAIESYEIVDFSGRVLFTDIIGGVNSSTSVNLPTGLYILRVLEAGKTKVAKKFYVN